MEYLTQRGSEWTRAGNRYHTLCPLVSEDSPSFNFYPSDAHFHCFSCGFHGTVHKLVARLEFPHFPSELNREQWVRVFRHCEELGLAVISRSQPVTITEHLPTSTIRQAWAIAYEHYHKQITPEALRYLHSRGLHRPMQLPLGFGNNRAFKLLRNALEVAFGRDWFHIAIEAGLLARARSGYRELCAGRIFIAERRHDEVLHFQARAIGISKERYLSAAFERPLFGLETLDRPGPVLIVEGPFDALPIMERGGAVLALWGSAYPRELLTVIPRLRGREVGIATDWEAPFSPDGKLWKGELAAQQLSHLFAATGVEAFRVAQPPGCKDLGEWAEKFPHEIVSKLWTTRSISSYTASNNPRSQLVGSSYQPVAS